MKIKSVLGYTLVCIFIIFYLSVFIIYLPIYDKIAMVIGLTILIYGFLHLCEWLLK